MGSLAAAAPLSFRSKPRLTLWEIWNISFGFLGIPIGFALQYANVSRIFETLGARVQDIPILWIAAPVTGLLIQPIVGYLSDRTWNRLGRRRACPSASGPADSLAPGNFEGAVDPRSQRVGIL